MKNKKYNFFESYHKALSHLSDERYGALVRALGDYVFYETEPTFLKEDDIMLWELLKPIIDKGNEISQIRSKCGSLGGFNGKGVSRNIGNKYAAKQKEEIQNNVSFIPLGKKNRRGRNIQENAISVSCYPDKNIFRVGINKILAKQLMDENFYYVRLHDKGNGQIFLVFTKIYFKGSTKAIHDKNGYRIQNKILAYEIVKRKNLEYNKAVHVRISENLSRIDDNKTFEILFKCDTEYEQET